MSHWSYFIPPITPTPTDVTPTPTEPPVQDGDDGIEEGLDAKYFQTSELPNGYILKVEIESPIFNSWYDSYFKDELFVIQPECAPECSASEIEETLEFTFMQDEYWVAVEVGRILYTHSG